MDLLKQLSNLESDTDWYRVTSFEDEKINVIFKYVEQCTQIFDELKEFCSSVELVHPWEIRFHESVFVAVLFKYGETDQYTNYKMNVESYGIRIDTPCEVDLKIFKSLFGGDVTYETGQVQIKYSDTIKVNYNDLYKQIADSIDLGRLVGTTSDGLIFTCVTMSSTEKYFLTIHITTGVEMVGKRFDNLVLITGKHGNVSKILFEPDQIMITGFDWFKNR